MPANSQFEVFCHRVHRDRIDLSHMRLILNKAEQPYIKTEKELLSIVWAVKNSRPYLLLRQFKMYADHRPLTWLFNVKDPCLRLLRWRLKSAEYQYEVIYKTGKSNTNADALSRIMEVKVVHTRYQQQSAGSFKFETLPRVYIG